MSQQRLENTAKDILYIIDHDLQLLMAKMDGGTAIMPLSDILMINTILKAGKNETAALKRKQAAIANFGLQVGLNFGERGK